MIPGGIIPGLPGTKTAFAWATAIDGASPSRRLPVRISLGSNSLRQSKPRAQNTSFVQIYLEGLPKLQERVRELFPGVDKFSAATTEQQDQVLASLDEHLASFQAPFRPRSGRGNFFETVRQHTLAGFLIDPDSDRGGNRDGVGWKVIGREREHTFQPPFGYYDKDYRGWQPASQDNDKK